MKKSFYLSSDCAGCDHKTIFSTHRYIRGGSKTRALSQVQWTNLSIALFVGITEIFVDLEIGGSRVQKVGNYTSDVANKMLSYYSKVFF